MQIALSDIDTALVGWFDDMTLNLAASLRTQGIDPKELVLAVVFSAAPEGAVSEIALP